MFQHKSEFSKELYDFLDLFTSRHSTERKLVTRPNDGAGPAGGNWGSLLRCGVDMTPAWAEQIARRLNHALHGVLCKAHIALWKRLWTVLQAQRAIPYGTALPPDEEIASELPTKWISIVSALSTERLKSLALNFCDVLETDEHLRRMEECLVYSGQLREYINGSRSKAESIKASLTSCLNDLLVWRDSYFADLFKSRNVPFVVVSPTGKPYVDREKVLMFYKELRARRLAKLVVKVEDNRDIAIRRDPTEVTRLIRAILSDLPKEHRKQAIEHVLEGLDLDEGNSTLISFKLPHAIAEALKKSVDERLKGGDPILRDLGVAWIVEEETKPTEQFVSGMFRRRGVGDRESAPPGEDAGSLPDVTDAEFAALWSNAVRRERVRRPFRRLRWLCSPRIYASPLAKSLAKSDDHAYARFDPSRGWRPLATDVWIAYAQWPILTGLLLAATLGLVHWFDPRYPVWIGVFSGLALSLAGAQVCSTVISPIAAGAGGIGLGFSFGLAQAMLMAKGSSTATLLLDKASVRSDLFTAITGGVVGLSAPGWRNAMHPAVQIALLTLIALGIAASGALMAQPRRAASPRESSWRITEFGGIAAGICVGASIKIIDVLTHGILQTLGPGGGFATAFSLVGAIVFGVTVWLRRRPLDGRPLSESPHAVTIAKPLVCAAAYGAVTLLLCGAVLRGAGHVSGIVALAGASGWYHATWFTGTFVVAERIGSPRAAVVATIIEGVGGFLGFVVSRMLA